MSNKIKNNYAWYCKSILKTSGFTLIEILITLFLFMTIVSIGTIGYGHLMARAKEKVCITNLKTLKAATEMYISEHDVLPGL